MAIRYLPLLLAIALGLDAAPASAPRVVKTLNRDWTFQYSPRHAPDLRAAQPAFDDSHWPAIALPHTWNTYETTGDLHPFICSAGERDDTYWSYGWGWYRKQFTIGRQYASRLVAGHKGGYTGFGEPAFLLIAEDSFDAQRANAPGPRPTPPRTPEKPTRAALRGQIKSTLFVPDPLPRPDTETYGEFEPAPGVVGERVSYATAYGLRVPAIVYRPKQRPAGKMPGIVVVNGHGGDKFSWYSLYTGILYARAGATVVTYDPIGEGERNAQRKDGSRQHDRTVDPPEMGRRMGGLMVTDVMQAVSYLAQRADTDPHRLAAVGYSMGSFVLGIACAVETRLNSCVLAGGGNLDGPAGYWDSSSKLMCQAIPYKSLLFLGDRGAVLYDLHADRGATLVINGTADDVVSIPRMGANFFDDLRKRTIALHRSDTNVFDVEWNRGGGHRPYWLTRPAALWLEKHLHFPNWTAASIAAMPETHIREWAEKNTVVMDKLYATKLREGGTRALGNDIPAVPHDDMNALPVARWNRDKNLYVYETWVKNAQALLR